MKQVTPGHKENHLLVQIHVREQWGERLCEKLDVNYGGF